MEEESEKQHDISKEYRFLPSDIEINRPPFSTILVSLIWITHESGEKVSGKKCSNIYSLVINRILLRSTSCDKTLKNVRFASFMCEIYR